MRRLAGQGFRETPNKDKDKQGLKTMKKPIELAKELATYGLYGAGKDSSPELKEFGADCLEAAMLLLKTSNRKHLRVSGQYLGAETLAALARGLRYEAEDLRK